MTQMLMLQMLVLQMLMLVSTPRPFTPLQAKYPEIDTKKDGTKSFSNAAAALTSYSCY